jgi:RNA polymerase sigma-70 factor (ECF subfamily)
MEPKETKSQLFFQLFIGCQNRIYTFLLMMVHNDSDAEDLLQETASAMWEHFDEFEQDRSFTAWGIGIARNKALNFLRKNVATRAHFKEETYTRIIEIATQNPDNQAEHLKALKTCLEKLQPLDRKMITLRYERNVAIKKIGEIFGRSPAGIYKTMARIHAVLERCVKAAMIQWDAR